MMRLGILSSHPIQYQAPFFRALNKVFDLQVFFAHHQSPSEQAKAGFDVEFDWDVELLDGYPHEFLNNISVKPDVNTYSGCDTPEIREKIKSGNFDLFLVTGWYLKSYWQAIRACRSLNIPVIVRGDSQLITPRSILKRMIKEGAYRLLLRQFDGFLSVGKGNRDYLKHYGVPEKKIFFSPHFIDNEWFQTRSQSTNRVETLTSLGCDPESLIVLFIGKFIDKKRPLDLLYALHQLKQRRCGNKIQALFVGAGDLEGKIRKVAKNVDVPMVIAGFKNQTALPAIYAAADFLVLPSESETWGLVVNEAMACGTPAIVSSSVGCAPDMIEPGLTGEIFPVGNIEALATSIEKTLEYSEASETKNALAKKMNTYSVENAVKGVLNASRELTGNLVK